MISPDRNFGPDLNNQTNKHNWLDHPFVRFDLVKALGRNQIQHGTLNWFWYYAGIFLSVNLKIYFYFGIINNLSPIKCWYHSAHSICYHDETCREFQSIISIIHFLDLASKSMTALILLFRFSLMLPAPFSRTGGGITEIFWYFIFQ